MKKNIFILAILLISLSARDTLRAQSKIGTINISAIMSKMLESKSIEAKIKQLSTTINNRITVKENEFQDEIKKYNSQYETLNKQQRVDYEKKLGQLEQTLEKMQESADKELADKQKEFFKPLIAKVQNAVKSVAQEKGFSHVLNKQVDGFSQVIYALPSNDITQLVSRKLGIK